MTRHRHLFLVDAFSLRTSCEDSGEESANQSDDSNPKTFPYPLGTWVAVEFGEDGVFAGTVTKIYPGEDLCEVTFSDGDKEDYDADQICYATQLYKREFDNEPK